MYVVAGDIGLAEGDGRNAKQGAGKGAADGAGVGDRVADVGAVVDAG